MKYIWGIPIFIILILIGSIILIIENIIRQCKNVMGTTGIKVANIG
jgi:hypothetical protein